jgi:hypothetical protein
MHNALIEGLVTMTAQRKLSVKLCLGSSHAAWAPAFPE